MLPQVSVPMANGTSPAATADPEPLELPPLHCDGFHGLRPGPVRLAFAWRYPIPPATSTMLSLATSTAPASRSFATTAASRSITRSLYGAQPQVVAIPLVASRSLAP